jgi:predicted Rossmann fold flavoprotein
VERQQRLFPVSDKSASVVSILKNELARSRVEVVYGARAEALVARDGRIQGVRLRDARVFAAERVILATGGVSYPETGSTGEGMKMAAAVGHSIVPLRPGLVPLETEGATAAALEGLALRNVRLAFVSGKNRITSEVGDLLFTSFGVSGPLVLSASGRVGEWLGQDRQVWLEIDLKPALSAQQLQARLQRELAAGGGKSVKNMLKELLPLRLLPFFLAACKLSPERQCAQISRAERAALAREFKGLRLSIRCCRPIEEAMVTRGGVSLKEINPRTMESRLIKGLYFCGEMIDVDADTGGFNLQAAFSTGYLAGESV